MNLGSPDAAQFSFNALNGTCSGIEMPITLTAVGSTTSTFSNTTFTLDCTNPAYPQLHLAQPAQNHFCMSPQSDKANVSICCNLPLKRLANDCCNRQSKFYVTSDMACSNTNVSSADSSAFSVKLTQFLIIEIYVDIHLREFL